METRKEILTEDTVNCIDELMVEENHVNAVYEIWIPADEYFGIDLDECGDTFIMALISILKTCHTIIELIIQE